MYVYNANPVQYILQTSEGVADLIPYEDKLKLISHSIYCTERPGDLLP